MSLGLYVHFPFCPYLCNYCDYFKVLHLEALEEKYFTSLITETRLVAAEIPPENVIDTLYMGGGTPSLVNLDLLEKWLIAARVCFDFSEDLEFSFECNIDSVDVDRLSGLKALGVTRPILGIQSFDEQLLKTMTRPHSPRVGHQAVYHAHVLGFESFNIDMLFGIPGQTSNMFLGDIDQLVDIEPPHISLYQLVVEDGTPLAESVEAGDLVMPDESILAAMYCAGIGALVAAGYEHYEVCSFALPGHECRHNLNYWQGGDYVGLGPSAHSYIRGKSSANVESVGEYIKSIMNKEIPRTVNESALLQRADDTIKSGLRLKRGIDRGLFVQRFGIPLDERINQSEYELLLKASKLIDDGDALRISDASFLQADEIARRLSK